ncbi:hypothetical protein HYH02_011475 [Chlamydomonas schloesseri]|uniref:Multiple inositol polyphosphate phosphatase 1 n=1 Tax=Chlamydomonas schloesseri TaxID=2026947 RepID=A0A835T081_9CHLO|nr:hypothetical protein HYH02_011475 [Chlamydomonas schloesseri]|eukprot:KAG2436537.1 hypothetical protein HYH02_011475 [Chlamydomonas schloesseri]
MALAVMLSRGAGVFDVRRHLGTKTRYAYRLAVPGAPSVYKHPDPEGYEPTHLWLMARHGTRWPTSDRMLQINSLEALFRDARNTGAHPWLANWTAPFPDVGFLGGELHPIGADELWGLAYRLRKRFPRLSGLEYLPKRFPVVSTQVARTAASASAFTTGFFPEVGPADDPADDSPSVNPSAPASSSSSSLTAAATAAAAATTGQGKAGQQQEQQQQQQQQQGPRVAVMEVDAAGRPRRSALRSVDAAAGVPGLLSAAELDATLRELPARKRPQAVAMSMAPKAADPLLRFFDVCPAYAQHDEYTEKWMGGWMQGNWSALVPALEQRLGLARDMDPCEVEALWQLCLLEAGLEGVGDRACSLFTPQEAMQLEWVDDIHLLETQAWGADINYQIAAPLLRDAALSLKAAAAASGAPGTGAPAARLLFAHCETLIPLATLMGLFRPPAPQPPDASPAAVDAAVSAAAAQRHLQQVDTLEDLHMIVSDLHRLNDQDALRARSKARSKGGAVGSEDSHSCYPGRPVDPDQLPPPEGWYPMLPNDDSRLFKGARLAPYAANMALVLYRRRDGAAAAASSPRHLVRLLYNEQVLPIPGCGSGSGLDCDLDEFLERMEGKMDADTLDRLCGPDSPPAKAGLRGDGGASLMFDRKRVPSKSLQHRPGGFVRGGVDGAGADAGAAAGGSGEGAGGKAGGDATPAS